MPWQCLVADVGGELVEDPETGLWIPAYREVIVTVPRQSGKTTLILAWEVHRANAIDLWGGPQRIVYSAQDGTAARRKLIEDQFPILEARKAKLGIATLRLAQGSEAVAFKNGSRVGLMASGADSGHGSTVDLAVKDEFFADDDDRRDQALVPAMSTRANAQMLTASTMGTDESVPLNAAVDRGRAAVDAGITFGTAYIEYSMGDDQDIEDRDAWWTWMPALGHTIGTAAVEHAKTLLPQQSEFERAYGNRRTSTRSDRVIPVARWDAVCSDTAAPTGRLTYALDINPDRSAGAIAAASAGVGELIEYRPSIGWMVGRAVDIDRQHGHGRWIIDPKGPAGSLVEAMRAKGLDVVEVGVPELVAACAQTYDGIMEGTLSIRRHHRLDEAAAAAVWRLIGDAKAWGRKNTAGDVCPLVALTLALWGAGKPDQREPNIW
jgi:hypothetical protein